VPAYRVEFAASVRRDFQRLAPSTRSRVDERIKSLAMEPRRGSQKLTGQSAHRARVGDHRILYEIDDGARVITITRVRHRREVYRKLR